MLPFVFSRHHVWRGMGISLENSRQFADLFRPLPRHGENHWQKKKQNKFELGAKSASLRPLRFIFLRMNHLFQQINDQSDDARCRLGSPVLLSRRKALGMMFATGAALLAGSESASALFFRKPANPDVDLDLLPANWVEKQGQNLTNYMDFLARLKLENISVQQVINAHAKQKGGVWNQLPHSSLWKNIATTLKATDRIARQLNVPVKEIVSAYRAPAYNARCAGARRASWHQTNFALDVSFPVRASVVTRTAREMRNKGLFRGGVGGYSQFTHIDTRGTNMDW